MNARASLLVTKIQTMLRKLRDLRVEMYGLAEEYAREGEAAFTDQHWLDSEGTPRTDLDITKQQLASGMNAITDTLTTMNAHASHFINAAN